MRFKIYAAMIRITQPQGSKICFDHAKNSEIMK